LQGLIKTNEARLLSNPRMTVLSGRTAGFLVGGQIPIPSGSTTNASGTSTTIAFKDFGILVNVIPVASVNGVVTMRIYTSVSQLDNTIGFNFPGSNSTIPGFSLRTAVSEVTVQPGGSIAIGGLISNDVTRLVQRIPFLSKIPVLGSLFTSRRFQRNQTELMFFVTPQVMPNPLSPGETAPVTVFSGSDNNGTPGFGTGSIQANGATSRSVSDGRLGFPPAAGGGNVTGSTNTNAPGGGSGSSQ
jgi:pilus assembly protein CpaC